MTTGPSIDGLALPSAFDGLETVQLIGRGGCGALILCRETALDRLVAVKVLLADLVTSQDWTARFHREMRMAAALHHPHVVEVYRSGVVNESPYLVMEYLPGGDLASYRMARGGFLPGEEAVRLVLQAAEGLAEAHRACMVHRDVKPHNVLMSADRAAKVGDFGLARLLEAEGWKTRTGIVVGTPRYMAPEARRGEPQTPRSDVWALALTLHELMAGCLPGEESEAPPIPPQVAAVLAQALDPDPSRRPADAGAFRHSLTRAAVPGRNPPRGGAPTRQTSSPPLAPPKPAEAATTRRAVPGDQSADRPPRRTLRLVIPLALVALALLAFLPGTAKLFRPVTFDDAPNATTTPASAPLPAPDPLNRLGSSGDIPLVRHSTLPPGLLPGEAPAWLDLPDPPPSRAMLSVRVTERPSTILEGHAVVNAHRLRLPLRDLAQDGPWRLALPRGALRPGLNRLALSIQSADGSPLPPASTARMIFHLLPGEESRDPAAATPATTPTYPWLSSTPGPPAPTRSRVESRLGLLAYSAAVDECLPLVQATPDCAWLWWKLGFALEGALRPTEAVAALDEAFRRYGPAGPLFVPHDLGRALAAAGRHKEALAVLTWTVAAAQRRNDRGCLYWTRFHQEAALRRLHRKPEAAALKAWLDANPLPAPAGSGAEHQSAVVGTILDNLQRLNAP